MGRDFDASHRVRGSDDHTAVVDMTPEQFVYWMKGMVASLNEGPPHATAWATILDELKKVEGRQWPMPYVPPQIIGPPNPNPLAPPYIVT